MNKATDVDRPVTCLLFMLEHEHLELDSAERMYVMDGYRTA
jgi:hypothetical protein